MEKRIIELMEYYNLSSSQFADKIGVQRSSISHILSGRNKPSFDFLQKINSVFPNVDANWLLNGIGSIEKRLEKPITSIKEQDLFSQKLVNKEPINKQSEEVKRETAKNDEKTNESEPGKDKNKIENNEFTNVNLVKQIIFVYENNTFEIIHKK